VATPQPLPQVPDRCSVAMKALETHTPSLRHCHLGIVHLGIVIRAANL
jgi:hypothetical protein